MQLGDFNHAILMPQSPKRYPCQDTPGHLSAQRLMPLNILKDAKVP